MDEHELEETLRAGLERRAAEADVTAPVADRARSDVRRRRRTRWSVVGAAAAVVLVVGGVAVATRGGDEAGEPPVGDDQTSDLQPPDVRDWRTEYWGGVAVDVPADWGYGGAPIADEVNGKIEATACYPESVVGPDGSRSKPGTRGWVGRPIALTDVCAGYPWIEHSPLEEPDHPYVWLGAAVEPGVVEYANGVVEETVEVDGTTVTVASDDAALRQAILGSARVSEIGCQASFEHIPRAEFMTTREGRGELLSAEVCAYRSETGTTDFRLSYATEIDTEDFEAAEAAAEAAPGPQVDCDYNPFEFVVLRGIYEDPAGSIKLARTAVYEMGCEGTVDFGGIGSVRVLTAEAVAPWAHNGIPAVVYGPTGGKGGMIDSFIGPQG